MTETKVNAVNLKSADFMENDKLITLFTYERGLLSVRVKGVKKAQAKLKFASEPFCFGEYLLCGAKGGGSIVKGCEYTELFYGLRGDIGKFTSACAMLEFCNDFVQENEPNTELFSLLLKSLNMLCYGSAENENAIIFFLINALKACGYNIDYSVCANCKNAVEKVAFINLSAGGFFCENCRTDSSSPVPAAVYKIFKFIYETNLEKLSTIRLNKTNSLFAVRCLNAFIGDICGKTNRSLSEYVNLK